MKVKIREYTGEILNAKGATDYRGGYMGDDEAYIYSYTITLLVNKNVTVRLYNVKPEEIEVVAPTKAYTLPCLEALAEKMLNVQDFEGQWTFLDGSHKGADVGYAIGGIECFLEELRRQEAKDGHK